MAAADPGGLVVVTSRVGDQGVWGPLARVHRVGPLAADTGGRVLADLAPGAGDAAQARELTARLGGLPLALHQAGSYLASPFCFTAATMITAWILHKTHPHWWPVLYAVTTAVVAAVSLAGSRLGLTTRAERGYAMTVVVAAGGWLAAATAAGPGREPLPALLAAAVCVLGVPWWLHRRRRARVRVERTLAAWPEIAQAVGLPGSRVMSAVVDVWGWQGRFALARGQTIQDVIARLPAIESGLGTFRGAGRVYPTPDDLANRFELRILDKDPLADAIAWPGPSVRSITEPIDLGPFEDAIPAQVLLLRRHGLLGGATGAGKSGGLNVVMGNLTACADAVIWAVDLKRGMELGPWASCIDRLATTPAEARALLADAVAILEARAAFLAAAGRRVWEPSPDLPALVIIIDEYAELVESAPNATGDADSIARRGRAVAVTLIAATQRPTQKAMGQGALRSQMDVRICFRVRERKDVDLTDQTVNSTASLHAGQRPELDAVSVQALIDRADTNPATGADVCSFSSAQDTGHVGTDTGRSPEMLLWGALSLAPSDGISVPDLMIATRMSRPWIYQRLREMTDHGQVIQASRGRWRARTDHPE